MSQAFSNFVCWKPDRIGAVINKEALSVDRADFLATHVPMRQITFDRAPRAVTSASEDDLLAELHHQADSGQHTFAVIKGVPGTGKSHLIRWLKERYASERAQDAVLLIERANTSLRGTLQQIIDSDLFDRAGLPDSLQRLHEAVTELTADALADNLLDQIKTAILEVEYAELPNRISSDKVYRFLLDVVIREHLKLPGGPIERIATFLTHGRDDNSGSDEMPGFEPADFVFKPDLLRRLQGYPEAKKVADDLQYKPELRDTLAKYLNHLLRGYAISRATRLSAQDLREMFNELRIHLRKLGLELALFVEDITAFTGIDEGLLDVLITQHTGESNRAYCRLTSVVGVTDAYFSDYMPDNFKERATHQLTLSSGLALGGSDLMTNEEVRAEFAARYLNAMRLGRSSFEQWVYSGAFPAAMPIACNQCPFQDPCFEAFGYVELSEGDESLRIGTYPFNRPALDTLFRRLKDSFSRTPRTFLFDLLGYIMQSHGERIAIGDFPPPENELAPAVLPPAFYPVAHRQLVEKQGGAAAARLSSLLLFWGDRSATRISDRLGSLPEAVFQAFSIRVIEGTAGAETTALPPAKAEPVTSKPVISSDETERYTQLIDTWMSSGRLSAYDRFAEWMADLARSFIDWQAHGISLEQVKEYVTQGRFEIEGQTGSSLRKHKLFFARSPQLRFVLQALVEIHTNGKGLTSAAYAEHIATLSIWIRSEEHRIVAFVREPSGGTPPPEYLVNILVRNVVLLACLSGELTVTTSVQELYHQIIASCVSDKKWEARRTNIKDSYPVAWRTLMREVGTQDAVAICRNSLLQLLNRPQGRSEAVRYVDAAQVLRILNDLVATDWTLADLPIVPETTDPTWSAATLVYHALQKGFSNAIAACYAELEKLYTDMTLAIGEVSPVELLELMRRALEGLRVVGLNYNARLDESFSKDHKQPAWTAESFVALQKRAAIALQKETLHERAMYAGGEWVTDIALMRERMAVFMLFEQEMAKKTDVLADKIADLSQKTDAAEDFQTANENYDSAILLLETISRENHA